MNVPERKGTNSDMRMTYQRPIAIFGLIAFALLGGMATDRTAAQERGGGPAPKQGTLLKLPLPVSVEAETRMVNALESIASRATLGERPIVVLEFVAADGTAATTGSAERLGRGTSFERALSIARWLSGPRGNRVRSVAYVPESIGGHAVLIALACEEIAMHPSAEIGLAGIDEWTQEATIVQAYTEIASRRGLFPPAAVRSMLNPSESLIRLDMEGGGVEYTTAPELERQLRPEKAWSEKQLVPSNQMGTFSGQELRSWRWITHVVSEPDQLGAILKLDSDLRERPSFAEPRKATRTHIRGIVSPRQVDRAIRAIDDAMSNEQANLILIEIDSPGGNLSESLRLAFYLANIPPTKAEVVVFVSGHARGDASLIAMAADSLFLAPGASVGGAGEASISTSEIEKRKPDLDEFCKLTGRDPGDVIGGLCPDVAVFEYQSANGRRVRAPENWFDDNAKLPMWAKGNAVDYQNGIDAARALDWGLAADQKTSLAAVAILFGLESLPEEKQTNATEQFVEWIASQRWMTMTLFFIGLICLLIELNAPGIGIPAAIATVCFLLFFWINLFQGTIEWLEILLIIGGVACLAVELLVLPGFGVFGICGLALLVSGLLLAGQTFVLPTNAYQNDRVIQGLGQLGLVFFLVLGLVIAFRKQIAKLPMLRWFALQPPASDRYVVAMDQREDDRRSMLGSSGTTTTRCNPYGKARVGDAIIDVVTEHEWIDEDSPVEVVAVRDHRLVIRSRSR